jgi:hypothetical protein
VSTTLGNEALATVENEAPRQIGWVISVEDWALIRRLVADGVPQRQVARDLGIGRSTVARAVVSDRPPTYERKPVPTSFTPFESRVRAILTDHFDMPAAVIAERVGWTGSITWFRDNLRRLRPEHRRPDPADRLTWAAGDAAQCDLWFQPRRIPLEDGSKTLSPVLVITAAHSRFTLARMAPTRRTEDLLLATRELLVQLGRVPRRLIWDNEPGIGRGKRHARPRLRAHRPHRRPGRWGGRLMSTAKKPAAGEALKQIHYLAAALKAPRITESATRLADHACDAASRASLALVTSRAQRRALRMCSTLSSRAVISRRVRRGPLPSSAHGLAGVGPVRVRPTPDRPVGIDALLVVADAGFVVGEEDLADQLATAAHARLLEDALQVLLHGVR